MMLSRLPRIEPMAVARLAPLAVPLVLALLLPGVVPAAQKKEPKEPKLGVTLQFVADKVNQQGPVNVAGYLHDNATGKDSIVHLRLEQSNVKFEQPKCKLGFHWRVFSNGAITTDKDVWMLLSDVNSVEVIPKEAAWKRDDSKQGNTTLSYKADPPVSVLRLNVSNGNSFELNFYDEGVADRVAKALEHAVGLCGGGKEAF